MTLSRWLGVLLLPASLFAAAGDQDWQALDAAGKELHAQEAEEKLCNIAIDACREAIAASKLGAERQAVEAAEKAVAAAQPADYEKMQKHRAARDAKVETLMVQVPFLAMNGEFEWCGPVGGGHASGAAGIRPEYGNQTQWVMIREQMLRLWRNKQEHRMTLVVVPNADHGAWDVGLAERYSAIAHQDIQQERFALYVKTNSREPVRPVALIFEVP